MQIGQDLKPRQFTSLQQFKVRKMERRLVVNLPKVTQGQVTGENVQKEMQRMGFRTKGKGKQWNDGLMWMIEYENQEEKMLIMNLIKKMQHDNNIKLMVNQQQDKHQINECQSGKINEQKYKNVKQDRQEQGMQKREQSVQKSKKNDSFQQLSESSEQFQVLGNGSSINEGIQQEFQGDEQEISQFIESRGIQSNVQQSNQQQQERGYEKQCLKQSIAQGIQQQPQQQIKRQTIKQANSKHHTNIHEQKDVVTNNNEQQQRVTNEQQQLVNRQSQKYILHLEEALLIGEDDNNRQPIKICDQQQQQQQQGQQQNVQAHIEQEEKQEKQVIQGNEKQSQQKEEKSQQQQSITFKINVDYQHQQPQVQKETDQQINCIQPQLQYIPQIQQQSNIQQSQQSNILPQVEQIKDTHNHSTNINSLQIQQQQQKQNINQQFIQYTDRPTIIQTYCGSDNLLINQESQPISQLVTLQNQLLSPISKLNQETIPNINANTNTQNNVKIEHQHQHHHNTGQSSQQSLTLSEQNVPITQNNDTSHKQPQLIYQTNPQQPKTQKRQPLINKALLQMKNSESIMEIIEDKDESDRLYITETPYPIQTHSYPISINSYNKSQKKSYRCKNIQKPYKMQTQSSCSSNQFNSQRYAVLGFLTGVFVLMVYLFYL